MKKVVTKLKLDFGAVEYLTEKLNYFLILYLYIRTLLYNKRASLVFLAVINYLFSIIIS